MNKANVSLVAFYGDKPIELVNSIARLQEYLTNHQLLQGKFVPYQLEQVHGTIIGCEGLRTDSGIVNQWFKQKRESINYLDFSGLINHLQQQVNLPLTIRIGGYDRQTDYNFLSRDRSLFERSFQLQPAEDKAIPVLIGWSWQDNSVTLAIDKLRRSFQSFGLLHKYHAAPDAVDNDFYLRLGTIDIKLSTKEINLIATDLRNLLTTSSILIPIDINNLAFAQYRDLQLTPATTKIIPAGSITASQLEQLYTD